MEKPGVGAAEPVDGLFRVAHPVELAGRRARLAPIAFGGIPGGQQEQQRSGQLDFLDLLLSARDLLRHHGARADLARVYQRIFVDEFQDTDPLQAEILLLLAARDPSERDWRSEER